MGLTETEKKLLTIIGENSSFSSSNLQHKLNYKRLSTLSIRMSDLRKVGYIRGPYYHINLNAVGKNPVYNTFAEIRFSPQQYYGVFELLTSVDCWEWIFPTIQGDTFFAFFRSNSSMYITRLLNIMKEAGLLEYTSYSSQTKWVVRNPDFSGSIYPQIAVLFEEVDIDLVCPERTHDIEWRLIDLKVMQYLQVKTCSVSDIQRIEKRVYGRLWRRNEIKYSIEKIIKGGVAEGKHYNISPYPRDQCYAFLLLIKGENPDVMRFIANFGEGSRMYTTFTMCKDMGFIWCWTSPQLGPWLMKTLDSLRPRIQARCLQLKSAGYGDTLKKSFNEEHFDLEKQQWIFPFKKYEEGIEEILEKRKR